MKTKERIIIISTIALLFVPAVLSSFRPEIAVSIMENRRIPGFPQRPTSLEGFNKWPSNVDTFIVNHFYKRIAIIHYCSDFLHKRLGLPINQNVVIGKNNWLYIAKNARAIEKFRGIYTFNNEMQKNDWINELNRQARWSNNKGIDFMFVIIPSKPTVYPQYLPEKYTVVGPTLTDTVVEMLRNKANFKWLDLRPTLIEAAQTEKVFFEHDTHWNDLGSYLGYNEVMKNISHDSSVRCLESSQVSFELTPKKGGDLAGQLGLQSEFNEMTPTATIHDSIVTSREGNFRRDQVIVETSQEDLPRVLVLCDSFVISYMSHYLQESFSYSLYKNHRGLCFDERIVEETKPDIILIMITERLIPIEIKRKN